MAEVLIASSFDEAVGAEAPNMESSRSGVSWGAIFAGGVAAVGVSLILLSLGAGLGFAAFSPYAGASTTATGLAIGAVVWLIVAQWIASAIGGYIAGRLRTKWADPHSDEVFFRDTAHGMLAWTVGTILTVGIFAAGGVAAISTVGAGAAAVASQGDDAYFVDQLFRGPAPAAAGAPIAGTPSPTGPVTDDATRSETALLLGRAVGGMGSDADTAYLAQLVSARTGLSEADAQQRVDQVIASAKAAADTARKASATAAMMTAFSFLIGAFIAAVSGALGGKYRDELSPA